MIQTSQGDYFDNKKWRETLDDFCQIINKKYNKKFEAICPWGFEVYEDIGFLTKNIRRYFCYFGVDDQSLTDEEVNYLSTKVNFDLYEHIKLKHPLWFESIVCLLSNEKVHKLREDDYICFENEKLLSVTLKKTNNILDSYAKYLVCSLSSLLNTIGESRTYKESMVFRWRTYQLYLILEQIFSKYTPELTHFEKRLIKVATIFQDNAIQPFYNFDESENIIEDVENTLFDSFILKRAKVIHDSIISKEGNIIYSPCFHTNDSLSLDIEPQVYTDVMCLIKKSYNGFFI
ncbi:hypothetical protein BS333_04420 [Vibrio azureus]|nr:hypothetical protein BS333_04420 [Vibrio azureus]